MRPFLQCLDDEWRYLACSRRAAEALRDWATDDALRGFSDLEAVVAEIQRRGRPAESDHMLLALLRRAPVDDLAAQTVLRALMPGLKSLMRIYQLTGEPEEVATAVVEAAFERIRRYPCDRRPARVAANLLNDTRQTLWREGCRERRLRVVVEPLTEATLGDMADGSLRSGPTHQLLELVDEAVRLGHIAPSGARLILLTRVLDVSIEDLAVETGSKPQTIRKRRQRAETALARGAAVA